MPRFLLDMHCFGYFDDVNENKVVACFVDEFDCPVGERKEAYVAKFKFDRDCKVEMAKYRYKPNVETSLAISFKFENFTAHHPPRTQPNCTLFNVSLLVLESPARELLELLLPLT